MKLLIFVNSDIHCAKALSLMKGELEKHEVRIVISRKVGKIEGLVQELLELRKREYCEIEKNFAYKAYFYENVNSFEAIEEFKKFAPDLMISIRFGQIMKSDLIAIPRLGVINLHSGILPKYRGILASFWSIFQGENKIGTTLHYIQDKTIDTGDIISFSEIRINYKASLIENINNLYDGGCELIINFLRAISCGAEVKIINQELLGNGCYFSYPSSEEVEKFSKIMKLY